MWRKNDFCIIIALLWSQFIYCSPVWRPYLLKDINFLKCVQRCATKYMLNDFRSDYKSRLIALGLLPLMYIFELSDIMFCVRSLKSPTKNFNISEFIHFTAFVRTLGHSAWIGDMNQFRDKWRLLRTAYVGISRWKAPLDVAAVRHSSSAPKSTHPPLYEPNGFLFNEKVTISTSK